MLVGWFGYLGPARCKSIMQGVSEAIPLVIDEAGVMRSCLKEELVSRAVSGNSQRVVEEGHHRGLLGAYAEGFLQCFRRSRIIMAGTDIHLGSVAVLFSDHEKYEVRPIRVTGFTAWPASWMREFLERHLNLDAVNTGALQACIGRGRPRWCESMIRRLPRLMREAHSKQAAFDSAVDQLANRLVNGGEMKLRIERAYDAFPGLVSRVVKSSILSGQRWTQSDADGAALLAERGCYVRQSADGGYYELRIDEPLILQAAQRCLANKLIYDEAERAFRLTLEILGDNTSSKGNIFERLFVGLLAQRDLTVGQLVDLFLPGDVQRPSWLAEARGCSLGPARCGQAWELGASDDYEWLAAHRPGEVLFACTSTGPDAIVQLPGRRLLLMGIKLYGQNVAWRTCVDNFKTTDGGALSRKPEPGGKCA